MTSGKKNLTGINTRLLKLPNPFFRIKKGISRYLAISLAAGTIGFGVALLLLQTGRSPFVSLSISVLSSGLLGYGLLELWGFPQRNGRLSWSRLAAHAIVGTGTFAARWLVLSAALSLFRTIKPYDNIASLALAFSASFCIGYLLRRHVVFRR